MSPEMTEFRNVSGNMNRRQVIHWETPEYQGIIGSTNASSNTGALTAPCVPPPASEQQPVGIPSQCREATFFLWDASTIVKGFEKSLV